MEILFLRQIIIQYCELRTGADVTKHLKADVNTISTLHKTAMYF